MEYVTLNQKAKMPKLGYGVFMIPDAETERCVREAIDVGYRLIDTAQAYGNEAGVGNAMLHCGVVRPDRTKVEVDERGIDEGTTPQG